VTKEIGPQSMAVFAYYLAVLKSSYKGQIILYEKNYYGPDDNLSLISICVVCACVCVILHAWCESVWGASVMP
jgi:hypothetical protein